MQCPRCNYANRPEARFCKGCGQALTPLPPPASAACIQCGSPLAPNARFCGVCGASQSPAPPPPPLRAADLPALRPSSAYLARNTTLVIVLTASLLVALAAAFIGERLSPAAQAEAPPVLAAPALTPVVAPTADFRQAVIALGYRPTGQFGLRSVTGDPANRSDDNQLLTFSDAGETNSTLVWIDGTSALYGADGFVEAPSLRDGRLLSVWRWQDVLVTQTVSYAQGSTTGRVDTLRVGYEATNLGAADRQVGWRIMLDTLIGGNDGVPFVVPGRNGITDRAIDLRGTEVPDFIQALENADLTAPGVVVNLTLQAYDAARPDRLTLSAWCDDLLEWDFFHRWGGANHAFMRCNAFISTPDSAVSLYYDAQPLAPDQTRSTVFYYGLGGISSILSGNTKISLTFNRAVTQGDQFWVTALVMRPAAGQKVALKLPDGLELADGFAAEQDVTPGGDYTQVSWRLKASQPFNDRPIQVTLLPDNAVESQTITVNPIGIVR